MNCSSASKQWVLHDKKNDKFLELDHQEFKDLINDGYVQLIDKKLWNRESGKMVWIDGVTNR